VTAGYTVSDWTDFAIAVTATASTLAGLLFVAVSINLKRILEFPSLPARAGQTLTLFVTPLLVGLFLLVPGQASAVLAAELLAAGVLIGAFQVLIDLRSVRAEQETPVTWLVSRVFPAMVTCGSMVVAAATLLARAGGGLYWLVPGMLAAIVFGLVNAWVLLVEILR
jgi:hypothetical protein